MSVEFRSFRDAADAEWAARVMAESEPWLTLGTGYERSLKLLSNEARERYVATSAGERAGFIVLNMQGAFVGYVQLLGVGREYRGKGIGRALVEHAERRIFAETPNVFICVSDFNREARAFYEKLGYAQAGELRDFIVEGHSEILLRKSVGPIRPAASADEKAVLEFWFGRDEDDGMVAKQKNDTWWSGSPTLDGDMRTRFGALVDALAHGEVDWKAGPRGYLAMTLLADQFPRNIYRGTPRAFALDEFARRICREALGRGIDRALRPIERVFLYLPLEHSESRADQDDSVRLFGELARTARPDLRELFEGYLRYAERHREIIARFGRFPHRNRILGRESSGEEQAFLQTPGSSF